MQRSTLYRRALVQCLAGLALPYHPSRARIGRLDGSAARLRPKQGLLILSRTRDRGGFDGRSSGGKTPDSGPGGVESTRNQRSIKCSVSISAGFGSVFENPSFCLVPGKWMH